MSDKTAVVIDDEEDITTFLSTILEENGFTVRVAHEASGGEDLITKLETYAYHEALPTVCFITGVLIWLLGLVIFMWSIANVNFDFLLPESEGLRIILCLLHAAIWFSAGLVFEIAGAVLTLLKQVSAKLGENH